MKSEIVLTAACINTFKNALDLCNIFDQLFFVLYLYFIGLNYLIIKNNNKNIHSLMLVKNRHDVKLMCKCNYIGIMD